MLSLQKDDGTPLRSCGELAHIFTSLNLEEQHLEKEPHLAHETPCSIAELHLDTSLSRSHSPRTQEGLGHTRSQTKAPSQCHAVNGKYQQDTQFRGATKLPSLQWGHLCWQEGSLSPAKGWGTHTPIPQPEGTAGLTPLYPNGLRAGLSRPPRHTETAALSTPGGESLAFYCTAQCEHACWQQIHARDMPGCRSSLLFCPSHQHLLAGTDHPISDKHKKLGDLLHGWQEEKKI